MAHLADCPRSVLLWDSAPGLTNSEKYQVVGEERSPAGVGNLTQRTLILCSIVGCLLTVGGLCIGGNSTLFAFTFSVLFCFHDSFYFQVFFSNFYLLFFNSYFVHWKKTDKAQP